MRVPGIVIRGGWWVGGASEGGHINPIVGVTMPTIPVANIGPPEDLRLGPTGPSGNGIKIDINPYFGAAFFFLAGALRFYPPTATAGLIIGVSAAVINYGAGTAAAQEPIDFGSSQPGWLTPHF